MYQIITAVFVLIFSAQLSATAMTGVFNSNNTSSNNDSRSGTVFGKSSGSSRTTTTSQNSPSESGTVFGKGNGSSGGHRTGLLPRHLIITPVHQKSLVLITEVLAEGLLSVLEAKQMLIVTALLITLVLKKNNVPPLMNKKIKIHAQLQTIGGL